MTTTEVQAAITPNAPRPTPLQVIQIAAAAMVDPRTVRRHLAGKRGASTTDARIEGAVAALGLQRLIAPSR